MYKVVFFYNITMLVTEDWVDTWLEEAWLNDFPLLWIP